MEINLLATSMLSAFKYRLYPRPEQEKRLNRSLLLLCQLYNDLKAEEMKRYKEVHKSTSLTRFRRLALGARKLNKELQTVHNRPVHRENAGFIPLIYGRVPGEQEKDAPRADELLRLAHEPLR
jgi:helix-turn-helix protein